MIYIFINKIDQRNKFHTLRTSIIDYRIFITNIVQYVDILYIIMHDICLLHRF